jgi:hypothetical protein
MSFTAPHPLAAARHPHPDRPERQEASAPHEIKYRQDAARYVAAMLTELRQIAGKAGFDKLVTAIDAAYYEAYAAQDAHAKPAADELSEKLSEPMEQSTG